MNDWKMLQAGGYSLTYGDFVKWYLAQPIYGQILVLMGIFALLTLIVVGLYYLIKGIAYLVYYVLKGAYYLVKGIFLGLYGLMEGLYHAISGKTKPESKETENRKEKDVQELKTVDLKLPAQRFVEQEVSAHALYCTDCGVKFSEEMVQALDSRGYGYCETCGKMYRAQGPAKGVHAES